MDKFEESMRRKTLPCFTTKVNIMKFIQAIKLNEGDEIAIKDFFGRGKYSETKKTLQIFNIITDDMMLTEVGKTIAYSSEEEEKKEWFKLIMNYPPYGDFIKTVGQNLETKNKVIEFETIKKFWNSKGYGTSDGNRNDAITTFAHLIVITDIGEFKVGRQKNPSRIIISKKKLEEKMKLIVYDNKILGTEQVKEQVADERITQEQQNTEKDKVKMNEDYIFNIPLKSGSIAKICIPINVEKEDIDFIKRLIDIISIRKVS